MRAGMHENHGAARVERRHHRIELGVAEERAVVAREQADAAELQRIQAIADLVHRIARVPHRHGAECAEPLRPARVELGGVVVVAARQRFRLAGRAELHAGLRQRGERRRDVEPVHGFERELGRPVRIAADRRAGTGRVHRIRIEPRNEVKMNVDPARVRHALDLRKALLLPSQHEGAKAARCHAPIVTKPSALHAEFVGEGRPMIRAQAVAPGRNDRSC